MYRASKNDPYIKKLHFHQTDGKSFLRLHDLEKFGDNIAQKLPLLQLILMVISPTLLRLFVWKLEEFCL